MQVYKGTLIMAGTLSTSTHEKR